MPTSVQVTLNYANIDALLSSPGGQVDDYIRRLARQVEIRARVTCPRQVGNLADSHRLYRESSNAWGVAAVTSYALVVHNGTTKPYKIRARRAKTLSFIYNGRRVFPTEVQRTVTRSQPWLREALISEVSFQGI